MKETNVTMEIHNFLVICSAISVSSCYCYAVAKLLPKGILRFLAFFPVFCLFLLLPLNLSSVQLTAPTVFSVTWLATFKLLQLVFGNGPLSDPSLSLRHFVVISCFPINLRQETPGMNSLSKEESDKGRVKRSITNVRMKKNRDPSGYGCKDMGLRSPFYFVKKGLLLLFLVHLASYKDMLPWDIYLFLLCMYIYIGLEVLLGFIATGCQVLLGTELESPFNDPYLSTSLQDFWSRRWNRVTSSTLRSSVFKPIHHNMSSFLGHRWALILALMCTFLVSAMMHEVIFYYLGNVRPSWGTTLFFLVHGICCLVENILKRNLHLKWRLPQTITGPLIFLFVVCTFMWLVLPELIRHEVDDRVVEECGAVWTYIMESSMALCESGYHFLAQFSHLSTIL